METYKIFHENNEVLIVDKKCKRMAAIKYKDIVQYIDIVPQEFRPDDPNRILRLLLGFIDNGMAKLKKHSEYLSITCKMRDSNAFEFIALVLFIPIELFIYKWNNNPFNISRVGKTIVFRDNTKKRKFLHNVIDLYKMINNVRNYTLEVFERIIISGIDGENFVTWDLKEENEIYIITYKWEGVIGGQFDLVISHCNFENENDEERTVDITAIPKSDIIVREINNMLKYHIDDRKSVDEKSVDENEISTGITFEMTRFHCYIERLLIGNNMIENIWKLYPHLTKIECDQLVNNYNNGDIQCHSGTYDECEIFNGYGYNHMAGNYGTIWKYGSLKFKRWTCCPCIRITGVIMDVGIGYKIDIEETFEYSSANIYTPKIMNYKEGYTSFVQCKDFLYSNVINHIRNLDVVPHYLSIDKSRGENNIPVYLSSKKKISRENIKKYISGYGLPSPTTFCCNPKKLIL